VYDGWWKYEKAWEKAEKDRIVTNVHTACYEDLKTVSTDIVFPLF